MCCLKTLRHTTTGARNPTISGQPLCLLHKVILHLASLLASCLKFAERTSKITHMTNTFNLTGCDSLCVWIKGSLHVNVKLNYTRSVCVCVRLTWATSLCDIIHVHDRMKSSQNQTGAADTRPKRSQTTHTHTFLPFILKVNVRLVCVSSHKNLTALPHHCKSCTHALSITVRTLTG